ncbi:ethanolamine utilization protein EutQ, partial [Acinetobacter ursingii]
MKEVKLVDSAQLDFNLRGETSDGTAYVARALGADVSPNRGIGFARWEGAKVSWKLLYDEVIFVIEGCFE